MLGRLQQRTSERLETGATEKVCLTESLQSWWDNEAWTRATALEVCVLCSTTVLQIQRDNEQDSSLSVRDAPTASVFPVCPPPSIPSSLTSQRCVLAHSQCKSSVLLYVSGFPIMSPGVFHTPLSSLLPIGPIPKRRRENVQVCSITKMTPFTLTDMNGAEVLAQISPDLNFGIW